MEDQSRRDNLIFWGLDEVESETWEDCENKVRECMAGTLDIADAQDDNLVEIERAHRLGKKRDRSGKRQGIIVKFGRWKHKQRAKNAAKDRLSKDSGHTGNVRISEDFCQELRNTRKELLKEIPNIKSENPGVKVFLNHDKVPAGRNTYKYDGILHEVYSVSDREHGH